MVRVMIGFGADGTIIAFLRVACPYHRDQELVRARARISTIRLCLGLGSGANWDWGELMTDREQGELMRIGTRL